MANWAPPPNLSTTDWSNQRRYLSAESSALPGKYSTDLTPWIPGIHAALDDPLVWKVAAMKSAQIAWTDGVINNWIGRVIDLDPSPIIGMFAKADAAKEYAQEKFAPMVTATPVLAEKVDVTTSRKDGNRAMFKKFPGGFLKLVGSNSPSNVKSTPAPRVFVEEPDDASTNVGQQGDSIKLLEERTKTYHRRKVLIGGTPSVKGLSAVEDAYLSGDQRKFYVPCHECGESHVLDWENVNWVEESACHHDIYGHARPETAVYVCPHCGVAWDDAAKNANVKDGEWRATAEFRGVASFYINELYSPFPGSTLGRLAERYLEAKHKADQGDDTDLIVFVNSALGKSYEFASDTPDTDALRDAALEYQEMVVPTGGLVLTAGVDVQHDRLAVILRAWGRDEESWLIYWGELYGNTIDKKDPVWDELDRLLFTPKQHETGGQLMASAVSIDSSDGTTSDAVYHYVRTRARRGVMAVKGSSNDYGNSEIFSKPRQSIDTKGRQNTKASKYGLMPYIVGTHKAKDWIAGQIKLETHGVGRWHFYADVRSDYFEQVTAEVKAPSRRHRGRRVWQKKSGVRNEATDCEVYALHAARSVKVHLLRPAQWAAIEQRILQDDLFSDEQQVESETTTPPPQRRKQQPRRRGGFVNNWKQ